MITKSKIDYIVSEYNIVKASTSVTWRASDRKKALKDYISKLEREELYDLLVYMECGRDILRHNKTSIVFNDFENYRSKIKNNFSDELPEHIANYLLGKSVLDKYLLTGYNALCL